jgi:hypothetical protein
MWKRLMGLIQKRESSALTTFLSGARPVGLDATKHVFTISIGRGKSFEKERIEKGKDAIEAAAAEVMGGPVRLQVVMEGEGPASAPRPQAAPVAADEGEVHDSFVKNTMEIFGGHIVE